MMMVREYPDDRYPNILYRTETVEILVDVIHHSLRMFSEIPP
jgi:hypothetical protein